MSNELRRSLIIAAELAANPAALAAWLSWPRFSATSFRMVSALVKQGIAVSYTHLTLPTICSV